MYDVNGAPRLVDPAKLIATPELQALQALVHGSSFDKLCRTYDGAILTELTAASNRCRIAFMKTGMVVGFSSQVATADYHHAWNIINSVSGTPRQASMMMGLFMRWRMALRTEATWLTDKETTGRFDPLDGTEIFSARYFLSPNFVYQPKPKGAKRVIAGALQRAYSDYSDGGAMADAFRRAVKV